MAPRRLWPKRKAYALGGGAGILFLVGANVQAGWLYVLASAFLGVVAAGLLMPRLSLRKLTFARLSPAAGVAGEPVSVRLSVTNAGRARKGVIEGRDGFLSGRRFMAEGLPPKSSAQFHYRLRCTRRGTFDGGDIEVSSGFPFGAAVAKRRIHVSSPVVVHPRWVELASFPMLEAVSSPNEALHDRRRSGAGMEFYGIREYRAGDSIRNVHWKSAARTGRLVVREFEELPASRLGVLIDSGEVVGNEPETTFEDGVSAAASIAQYALGAGHPVQMFCDTKSTADELFEPGPIEVLDWLSKVEPDGKRGLASFTADVASQIQSRSTNVVIFPSTRRCLEDSLAAAGLLQGLGSRVVAVVVSARTYDPKSPTALAADEEDELIWRLAATRTLVYRVDKGKDLSECLREPFHF